MGAKGTEKEATNKRAAKAVDKEQAALQAEEQEGQAVKTEAKTTGQKAEKAAGAEAKAAEQKTEKVMKAATKEEPKTTEKTAKKQAPKKSTATKKTEKPEQKTEVFIEYNGHKILETDIIAQVKEKFRTSGHRVASIKTLQVYIKPEDAKAYYVINDGKYTGDVDLF